MKKVNKKKVALESYEMLLNKDSAWSQNILSEEDAVSGFHCLIDRNMVRELINLMKNRKAPGSLELVSEMVKSAGETKSKIIADLMNQTIIEELIVAEWELSTIGNC